MRSPSRRAAVARVEISRFLLSISASASASACAIFSSASDSAAWIYLRPRVSAPERIVRAFASAASNSSFVARAVSDTNRVAATWALLSRA